MLAGGQRNARPQTRRRRGEKVGSALLRRSKSSRLLKRNGSRQRKRSSAELRGRSSTRLRRRSSTRLRRRNSALLLRLLLRLRLLLDDLHPLLRSGHDLRSTQSCRRLLARAKAGTALNEGDDDRRRQNSLTRGRHLKELLLLSLGRPLSPSLLLLQVSLRWRLRQRDSLELGDVRVHEVVELVLHLLLHLLHELLAQHLEVRLAGGGATRTSPTATTTTTGVPEIGLESSRTH